MPRWKLIRGTESQIAVRSLRYLFPYLASGQRCHTGSVDEVALGPDQEAGIGRSQDIGSWTRRGRGPEAGSGSSSQGAEMAMGSGILGESIARVIYIRLHWQQLCKI